MSEKIKQLADAMKKIVDIDFEKLPEDLSEEDQKYILSQMEDVARMTKVLVEAVKGEVK